MANQNNQNEKGGENKKGTFLKSVQNMASNHWSFNEGQVMNAVKVAGLGLLALLCVFVFVKTINEVKTYTTIGEVAQTPYVINVYGNGDVKGVKDVTILTFSSYGKGKTATEAQSVAAEQNNKALAYLKSKGVNEKDISTLSYDTYPTYDQKVRPCEVEDVKVMSSLAPEVATMIAPMAPCNNYEQVIVGYETTHSVQVKVRNIETDPSRAGDVLTGLAAAGVRVGNMVNTIDNPEALKMQARQLAIADARAQAEQIARSLGVRLGKVASFYEETGGMAPMYEGAMMSAQYKDAAISPEIATGEAKIESRVSVTFEIRD
ncbi:MAG: hypothetical protein RIQ72_37 [Candidatus Parcubacteria bacterium]